MKETQTLGMAKISTKAQVTIPQDAREAFGLEIRGAPNTDPRAS